MEDAMKLLTWNVNGLRACLGKGFQDFFDLADADIFCLQETKMQQGQAQIRAEGYQQFWNSAVRKGYSGTAVFTKLQPLSVTYGIGPEIHGTEGRAITLELERFFLVNVYVPNAQDGLTRLPYRMQWEDDLRAYLKALDEKKPVILCGDLNVAHNEIDLKNPKANRLNAGFSDEERGKLSELLSCGFVDAFRFLYPDTAGAYTWWSYLYNARVRNTGWRIDYFLVSERLKSDIGDCVLHPEILGSDHCPVELLINP
jgi:exodeoxyribonuclease-3